MSLAFRFDYLLNMLDFKPHIAYLLLLLQEGQTIEELDYVFSHQMGNTMEEYCKDSTIQCEVLKYMLEHWGRWSQFLEDYVVEAHLNQIKSHINDIIAFYQIKCPNKIYEVMAKMLPIKDSYGTVEKYLY